MLRTYGEHFAGVFKGGFAALESLILKLHSSVYLQPDPERFPSCNLSLLPVLSLPVCGIPLASINNYYDKLLPLTVMSPGHWVGDQKASWFNDYHYLQVLVPSQR
jgi:hypothetical protein